MRSWPELLRIAALSAALCVSQAAGAQGFGPSFACPSPDDQLADVICHDSALAGLELSFVQAFQALRQQTPETGRGDLRQEAGRFNALVRRQCGLAPAGMAFHAPPSDVAECLDSAYRQQRQDWRARASGAAAEEASRPLEAHVRLQRELAGLGYLPAGAPTDGVYGPLTRSGIAAWQRDRSRVVTGLLGDTDAALLVGGSVPAADSARTLSRAPASLPDMATSALRQWNEAVAPSPAGTPATWHSSRGLILAGAGGALLLARVLTRRRRGKPPVPPAAARRAATPMPPPPPRAPSRTEPPAVQPVVAIAKPASRHGLWACPNCHNSNSDRYACEVCGAAKPGVGI